MGWAHCGEDAKGREIGYGIAATCDHPGCKSVIDRGLGYVCGGMHGGGEHGCGGYFCSEHRQLDLCGSCAEAFYRDDPEDQ